MRHITELVFYRAKGQQLVVCGRRDLSDDERRKLERMRAADLFADHELIDTFNADRPPDQQADAFAFGKLIIQMARS